MTALGVLLILLGIGLVYLATAGWQTHVQTHNGSTNAGQ